MTTKKDNTPALITANDVPTMLAKVEEQIKLVKGNSDDAPKTDKPIEPFGKIQDMKTMKTIIAATSLVIGKEIRYKEAIKLVVPEGVKVPAFDINGMTKNAMLDHLKARAIEVGKKEQLDKLNKIKAKLKENLSAEQKFHNDMQEIKGMLED